MSRDFLLRDHKGHLGRKTSLNIQQWQIRGPVKVGKTTSSNIGLAASRPLASAAGPSPVCALSIIWRPFSLIPPLAFRCFSCVLQPCTQILHHSYPDGQKFRLWYTSYICTVKIRKFCPKKFKPLHIVALAI